MLNLTKRMLLTKRREPIDPFVFLLQTGCATMTADMHKDDEDMYQNP